MKNRTLALRFLLLVTAPLAGCRPAAPPAPAPFFHGMIVTSARAGEEWASPAMAATLDTLPKLGVDAVALHPYAVISEDGSLRWDPDPSPAYLVQPLRDMRDRGLRPVLIPHIAYWGTKFLWRGDITFDTDAQWDRFFGDYEQWIVHLATLAQAHGVSLFCVGLEYGPTQKYATRWRHIIAAVRAVYHGPLTYGANWDEVDHVPFWDDLDYVGVLAYFPLVKQTDPSDADLAAGWDSWMKNLGQLCARHHKPLLFVEVGYNDTVRAASAPWDFHTGPSAAGSALQVRCIEQALRLPAKYPFLGGMFWWKWFPAGTDEPHPSFDLRAAPARAALQRGWHPRND